MGKLAHLKKALDMSKAARMKRAQEMGFDTETTWYHGTAADIPEFDLSRGGQTTGARSARQGVFLTQDPRTASSYADLAEGGLLDRVSGIIRKMERPRRDELMQLWRDGDFQKLAELADTPELQSAVSEVLNLGQNVMPLRAGARNPMIFDAQGSEYSDLFDRKGLSAVIQKAKEAGHDSLIIRNFDDDPYIGGKPADHMVVFEPEKIRSVNAAFDPEQAASPNLLAGLGAAGVGIAALGGSEDAEAGIISSMKKIKRLSGDMFSSRADGRVRYVDDINQPKVTIDDDGQAFLDLPPSFRLSPEYAETRGFRHVEELLWPYGDDVYLRVSDSPDDMRHIQNKTHRGSKNWHTGEDEGGLSVARDIEIPSKHAYLVRGKRIGSGSDSEPLLDINTVEVIGPAPSPEQLRQDMISYAKNTLGIDADDVKALRTAIWQRADVKKNTEGVINPSLLAPLAGAGAAGMYAQSDASEAESTLDDRAFQEATRRFQERRRSRGRGLLETGATLASGLAGGVVADLSRLGGYLNPFMPLERTEQGAQGLQQRLQYQPSEAAAPYLEQVGEEIDQFSQDISPLTDAVKGSIPGRLYESLPDRAKGIIETGASLVF